MLCREKNALIHEAGHFMTTLRECVLSLVYCSVIRSCRKIMDTDPEYIVTLDETGSMKKNLLKAVVVVVGVMIVDIVINVICNINGVDLNSISNTFVAVMFAMLLYNVWIKDNKSE